MYTGQAAGVAAALSVRYNTTPRNVKVEALQQALIEQNVVLFESVLKRLKALT
jgi:hypothetical protein